MNAYSSERNFGRAKVVGKFSVWMYMRFFCESFAQSCLQYRINLDHSEFCNQFDKIFKISSNNNSNLVCIPLCSWCTTNLFRRKAAIFFVLQTPCLPPKRANYGEISGKRPWLMNDINKFSPAHCAGRIAIISFEIQFQGLIIITFFVAAFIPAPP